MDHPYYPRQVWLEDGKATLWVVDHHTRHLLCWRFIVLCQQTVTHYRVEPELTAEEASNLSCLRQLAACTSTCLVPLGDHALLRPRTGDHPGVTSWISPQFTYQLCAAIFLPRLPEDPTGWPHHMLE